MAVEKMAFSVLFIFVTLLTPFVTGARKSCPPLQAPDNGRFEEMAGRPGRFKYYCKDGYRLSGSSVRSCGNNGQWSGYNPSCIPTDLYSCPKLKSPRNGHKWGESREPGATVTFHCDNGYVLIGPHMRTCYGDYQWSGYQPECERRQSAMDIAKALQDRAISRLASSTRTSDISNGTSRLSVGPNGLEIIVILDRSSSIHRKDFQKGKKFAKMILNVFGISPTPDGGGNGTRVALISFGDEAELHFNLNDPDVRSLKNITAALSKVKPSGGGTNLHAALDLVYTEVSHPDIKRPRATQAIFIITDGRANIGDPVKIAKDLRESRHFEIFAIGVGSNVDAEQLKVVASHSYAEHVFLIEDFSKLKDIGDIISEKNIDYSKCGVSGNIETDDANGASLKSAWPWHGWLNILLSTPRTCGGSLICNNWFMTSAHCLEKDGEIIDADKVELYLGDHVVTKVDKSEQAMKIRKIHIHPNYNSTTYENSVALIEIGAENTPELNKFIRPVCVIANVSSANAMEARAKLQFGDGWLTGWGFSTLGYSIWPKLHQAERDIIVAKECQKAYPDVDMERFICAGDKYLDNKFCRGDTGGSFVSMLQNNRFAVLGIAINTSHCMEHNMFGLYLNVLHEDIADWLSNTTASCSMPGE